MSRSHILSTVLLLLLAGSAIHLPARPALANPPFANQGDLDPACDPGVLFADRFEGEATGGLGTAGYSRLWTDTSTSGAGMHRLAVDPDNDAH